MEILDGTMVAPTAPHIAAVFGVGPVDINVAITAYVLPSPLARTSEKFRIKLVTTEVQWSELQRDPKSVAALADQGDVRVRRRDGVSLLLVREDRASASAEGAVTAARALRNALAHLSAQGARWSR